MLRSARRTVVVTSTLLVAACGGGGGTGPSNVGGSNQNGGSTQNGSSSISGPRDTTPPTFSVQFVNAEQALAFYVFGVKLPSDRDNPTYEIETADSSAEVFAVTDGFIVDISANEQGDQEIHTLPNQQSSWEVSYDHVRNVTVTKGGTVKAGQKLGIVGVLGNGRGRTELQINRIDQTPTLAYCPERFGTAAFNAAYAAASQRVNGSATVCTQPTVVP